MEVAAQEIGSTRVRDEKGLATGDGEKRSRRDAPEAGCAGGAPLLPRRRVVPVYLREDELRQHNEPRAAEADQHAVDATLPAQNSSEIT